MGNVAGVKEVQVALAKVEQRHAKGLEIGLLRAGLFLQRESMLLVPIQTGQLRATAATQSEGSGLNTEVRVSYGTEYAIYVHEDLEAAHGAEFNAKYADEISSAKPNDPFYFNRGPNQRAKFLETPLVEKRAQMAQIVKDAMEAHS